MKIKIYSPVDATIKSITECSDELFAAKTLGEGILIIPKKNNFKSPFEDSKVEIIFDTKHAIYFDVKGIKALMHIGLDTVKLNGSLFNIKTKEGTNVNLKSDIISADLKKITEAGLSYETPLVFEANDKKIEVKILKEEAKQGDLIAEILIINDEKKENVDPFKIKTFKNKYVSMAETIYKNLGGTNNYNSTYNCMTRFRTRIVDQSKVNMDVLKNIPDVKAVQYAGDELQIIIGQDVWKVLDEFKKIESNPSFDKEKTEKSIIEKNKIPTSQKVMGAMMGIMGPSFGLLIAGGLFTGIYTVLGELGAVNNVGISMTNLYLYDIFSALMYVLSKVILAGIGITLLYNVVKYFKGNTVYAIGIGLILVSRAFYPEMPTTKLGVPDPDYVWNMNAMIESGGIPPFMFPVDNYLNFGFGDYIFDPMGSGKQGFLLFRIGDYPIVVGGLEGSIFHFVFAGFVVVYSERWIKTWMPSALDIFGRPFLVVLITLFGTWFIGGPILSIVEYGILEFLTLVGQIPFGIGVAIFAFFLQILTLTGMHGPILLALGLPLIIAPGSESSIMLTAGFISPFGQVGASLGVGIATKNYGLKRLAYSSLFGGVLGVTEPILYGVTLPKGRPLIFGCIGAGIAGLITGLLGIGVFQITAPGIFGILGFDGFKSQAIVIAVTAGAFALSLGLTILFYKERPNESTIFSKTIKKLIWTIGLEKNEEEKELIKKELNLLFADEVAEVKAMKNDFEKISKYISINSKYEEMMISLNETEKKKQESMYNKLINLKEKMQNDNNNEKLKTKFLELNEKYSKFNLEKEKESRCWIENKIHDNNLKYAELKNEFEKKREKLILNINKKLESLVKNNQIFEIEAFKDNFWNGMYSVEIGFGLEDQINVKFLSRIGYLMSNMSKKISNSEIMTKFSLKENNEESNK